jgi:hypothetical protein
MLILANTERGKTTHSCRLAVSNINGHEMTIIDPTQTFADHVMMVGVYVDTRIQRSVFTSITSPLLIDVKAILVVSN